MKPAPRWWINGVGHGARQSSMPIRHGVSGQRRIRVAQHLGVGMERIVENLSCWTFFHQSPQVHDGDLVRHMFDHAKVVSDEEIRQLEFALERDE